MDKLKQIMTSIGESVGALSGVGRMAIGLLATVVILCLLLVVVLSSKVGYVPVAPGASAEVQRDAAAAASAMGIEPKTAGGSTTVPSDRVEAVRGALREAGKLTGDQLLFANLPDKQGWMNSREINNQLYAQALQNELARVVKTFPSVQDATVFVEVPDQVGIGQAARKPTGVVSVLLKQGRPLNQTMVDAIAGLVSGSKAGLAPGDVRVVDASNGRQYRVRPDGDFSAGDYLEHVAKVEDRVQMKIGDTLSYINGAIVAVTAHVDVRKTSVRKTEMLPDKQGSVAIVSKTMTKEGSTQTGTPGAEGGLRSNVGDDVNRGGSGNNTSDTTEETEMKVAIGSREESTVDPRGMPTKLNVTVNVPRTYIVELIRAEKKDEKAEPDQAEIDQRFATEKTRIEADVKPLVETAAAAATGGGAFQAQPGTVVVSMRAIAGSLATIGTAGSGIGGGGGGGGGGMVGEMISGGMVKNVVLGLLSVAALGMMLMLVKKAGKPVDLPTPQEIVGLPPALEAGADIVGEADEGATAMEGVELADDQLKVKKMLETIGDLVKNKPADAAGLMNRWLQTED